MSKSYKKKHNQEEVVIETDTLSKKEQYDLEKKNRLREKETKKKKKSTKTKQTNLEARIFAIFMLILMVSSVIVSALAYVLG